MTAAARAAGVDTDAVGVGLVFILGRFPGTQGMQKIY